MFTFIVHDNFFLNFRPNVIYETSLLKKIISFEPMYSINTNIWHSSKRKVQATGIFLRLVPFNLNIYYIQMKKKEVARTFME